VSEIWKNMKCHSNVRLGQGTELFKHGANLFTAGHKLEVLMLIDIYGLCLVDQHI
jgi:hypothetical protein